MATGCKRPMRPLFMGCFAGLLQTFAEPSVEGFFFDVESAADADAAKFAGLDEAADEANGGLARADGAEVTRGFTDVEEPLHGRLGRPSFLRRDAGGDFLEARQLMLAFRPGRIDLSADDLARRCPAAARRVSSISRQSLAKSRKASSKDS
jgi:hypothetical protein